MRKQIVAGEGAATYLLSICAASILGTILSYALVGRTGSLFGMSVAGWTNYALTQFAIALVVVLYGQIRKLDLVSVLKLRPSRSWKQYLLLPVIAIFCVITFLPLSMLFNEFLGVCGYPVSAVYSIDFSSVGAYFLALFLMALLPAICEELLCRGMLLQGLSTKSIPFGVLMSALLFSLMHANPMQTVHQFCLGVVLAIIALISGSIIPCMIVHFLNNFITLTVSAYLPEIDRLIADLGAWNYLTGSVSFIVGGICLVLLLYAYYRLGDENHHYQTISKDLVFDDVTFTVSYQADKKKPIVKLWYFVRSLFTKSGWRDISYTLRESGGITIIGKGQPLINVWFALGFAVLYWVLALISGLL